MMSTERLLEELDGWRDLTRGMGDQASSPEIRELFTWNDNDPPASDINVARIRGKYYGARYMILRTFVQHLLDREVQMRRQGALTQASAGSSYSSPHERSQSPQVKPAMGGSLSLPSKEEDNILKRARQGVQAAIRSTRAFDGYRTAHGRLQVTNVFGTAHAQFGNMLVLSAACNSRLYHDLYPYAEYKKLMDRTITFLQPLARLSPTMSADLRRLREVQAKLAEANYDTKSASQPSSATASFNNYI